MVLKGSRRTFTIEITEKLGREKYVPYVRIATTEIRGRKEKHQVTFPASWQDRDTIIAEVTSQLERWLKTDAHNQTTTTKDIELPCVDAAA